MELNLEPRQGLTLTPAVRQSLQCLQMSALELGDYLREQALSNPLLEVEDPPLDGGPILRFERPWERAVRGDGDPEDADSHEWYRPSRSLREYLEAQLGQMRRLDGPQLALCRYLVGCLNPSGYLDCPLSELAEELERPVFDLEQALFTVQMLDPPGVGARDLPECLLLQLAQGPNLNAVNIRLIREGLPVLAKGDYPALARLLGVRLPEAREAAEVIRRLNPIPAQGFDSNTPEVYLVPDAVVRCENGRVVLELNERALPRLSLNRDYCAMAERGEFPDAQPYLREKLAQARELMGGVQARGETLTRLLTEVTRFQAEYFLCGAALKPLTMEQAARRLGLNPSTVSRAAREKYIQFQGRLFPLKSLFSAPLRQDGVSGDMVCSQLRRFLESEDREHPLSDEALRMALSGVGIEVSRRTVAKYRAALHIPAAPRRTVRPDKD